MSGVWLGFAAPVVALVVALRIGRKPDEMRDLADRDRKAGR